jgi:hypothetical protein
VRCLAPSPPLCQACDTRQVTKAATRPVKVLAVLAALSLWVTACGAGPAHNGVASVGKAKTTNTQSSASAGLSSSGQSGPTEAQLLKYAECMRSHGEPNFPDPVPAQGGGYAFLGYGTPGSPLSPSVLQSPQYHAATKACKKDIPPSIANVTPAIMAAYALKYSDCMRAHGLPNFPEPNAKGLITINPTGIMDPNSPQYERAEKACQKLDNGLFDEVYSSRISG